VECRHLQYNAPPWQLASAYSCSSAIMSSWWKVSKHGWAHRQQTSLTQAYRNVFPDATSASIPVMSILISSLRMYIFSVYNKIFFRIVCFVNSSLEVTFRIALICS
jgi:hypothetical protein